MIRFASVKDLEVLNEMLKYFNTEVTIDDLMSHPFKRYIVMEIDNKVIGFLNFAHMYENIEIEYIFISEKHRNLGYALELVEYLIDYATDKKCHNLSLEVRISNSLAINLYTKVGFVKSTIRKNYYNNEDAILMVRKIGD